MPPFVPSPPRPAAEPAAPRPRTWLWLLGAGLLAVLVLGIFVLMPEPKSAGATDPAAPVATLDLDTTAFTLEEDHTPLPLPDSAGMAAPVDSGARPLPAADTTGLRQEAAPDSVPDRAEPAELPAAVEDSI